MNFSSNAVLVRAAFPCCDLVTAHFTDSPLPRLKGSSISASHFEDSPPWLRALIFTSSLTRAGISARLPQLRVWSLNQPSWSNRAELGCALMLEKPWRPGLAGRTGHAAGFSGEGWVLLGLGVGPGLRCLGSTVHWGRRPPSWWLVL